MALTRAFAENITGYPHIDLLVNNAGMASTSKPTLTSDGYELVFEIDYMNTWLLTELLLPQVRKGKGRIINVVSKAAALACEMGGHASSIDCMNLDKLPPPPISGEVPFIGLPRSNYGIAKLASIRWTEDLARREAAAGSGVTAFSLHPGFVATGIPASPMWSKLACSTDGREGAPCPTTPAMGALTPVFLALAPLDNLTSGAFYEWCYKSTLPDPMAGGKSKEWQEGLDKLTRKWLANYTKPLSAPVTAIESIVADTWGCPDWLEPMCKYITNIQGCIACGSEVALCIKDAGCKQSLMDAVSCMGKMHGKSANDQLTCLIPVNDMRDRVFYCLLDKNDCLPIPKDDTPYPACRDGQMLGDQTFSTKHLLGHWWKLKGWNKGEKYECRDCGEVHFDPYRTLPYPTSEPSDTSDYVIIASTWNEKNIDKVTVVVNETSLFGPRPDHKGYPGKANHRGVMYGLSYLENFTIVHDGTAEAEPFIFLYGCGSTKQGTYVTGFVMGKQPVVSPTLQKRLAAVAAENGFDDFETPGAWCTVDNSAAACKTGQEIVI